MEPQTTISSRNAWITAAGLGILSTPYFGPVVLIPATAYVLAGLSGIARSDAGVSLRHGATIALAHAAWMLVMAVAREVPEVLLDVFVLGGASLWCLRRPGFSPLLVLGVFQVYAAFVNVAALGDPRIDAALHSDLHLNVVLRVLSVAFLVAALGRTQSVPEG